MSFGIPEQREGCSQHGRIEDLVASNNSLVSSLAGQMKILLWVLGGCGMLFATSFYNQVQSNMKLNEIITTTISGVSVNRHDIADVKYLAVDNQKRISKVEITTVKRSK